MPAFGYYGTDVNAYDSSQDSGSGSTLDAVLASVSALGVAAITQYGPKNAGLATNQGVVQPGLSAYAPSPGSTSLIVIAVLLLAGVFLYKKL